MGVIASSAVCLQNHDCQNPKSMRWYGGDKNPIYSYYTSSFRQTPDKFDDKFA